MTQPVSTFGSAGEHRLQEQLGNTERAADFYHRQVRPHLTAQMQEFIGRQTMVFLASSDAHGACDTSFRAGPPGFVIVLDDHTLAYPEYRGNGVMATAGNITENPHLGLLFLDFTGDRIGLHVNGTAHLRPDDALRTAYPQLPIETAPGRRTELWVHISVDEAYIHCSKHIPHLEPATRGTRPLAHRPKDADYFTGPVADPAPVAPPTAPPAVQPSPSWARQPEVATRQGWRQLLRRPS
ncbi:putative pyridoxine 5'-phosphate oxidase superfamily flavin-nucleotide-binding protein [Kitasatospora sp. MAA4]|uniref:pyridoxamine 5'-phosphate oxidase family protein n=1 Tax=Kitasatospora sp. MAA4 TaxID=3035093 RepID=UPI0024737844|nr:pyridoxamine 5'-phosphate oxidase family protein [Kitasatospora sp. MAA4]MDH6130705.1 putative pyridoxine 5'-phosphate oxidase superfamily flavin-nucleotide-binding protein [Kitasatospora sp. MAA4]